MSPIYICIVLNLSKAEMKCTCMVGIYVWETGGRGQLTLVGKCSPVWKASRPNRGEGVNLTLVDKCALRFIYIYTTTLPLHVALKVICFTIFFFIYIYRLAIPLHVAVKLICLTIGFVVYIYRERSAITLNLETRFTLKMNVFPSISWEPP